MSDVSAAPTSSTSINPPLWAWPMLAGVLGLGAGGLGGWGTSAAYESDLEKHLRTDYPALVAVVDELRDQQRVDSLNIWLLCRAAATPEGTECVEPGRQR